MDDFLIFHSPNRAYIRKLTFIGFWIIIQDNLIEASCIKSPSKNFYWFLK